MPHVKGLMFLTQSVGRGTLSEQPGYLRETLGFAAPSCEGCALYPTMVLYLSIPYSGVNRESGDLALPSQCYRARPESEALAISRQAVQPAQLPDAQPGAAEQG